MALVVLEFGLRAGLRLVGRGRVAVDETHQEGGDEQ